jgi:hypothetical protein
MRANMRSVSSTDELFFVRRASLPARRGEVEFMRDGRDRRRGCLVLSRGERRVLGGGGKEFRTGQCGCRKSQRHGSKEVSAIHLRNGKGSAQEYATQRALALTAFASG